MKQFLIILAVIVLVMAVVAGAGWFLLTRSAPTQPSPDQAAAGEAVSTTTEGASAQQSKEKTLLGMSHESREITAYHFGSGAKELLFVGGIHGGYSWNTVLLAYELMDYLKANPSVVPENLKVTVIPVLNPDGLNKIVGTTERFTAADVPKDKAQTIPGRFNARTVDLNRNFDCDWRTSGVWQSRTVSGGEAPFSEPESDNLRRYVTEHPLAAAVVWYAAAPGVFASNCHNGPLPETLELTNIYAKASGYPAYESFDFYEITGDMVNWLSKEDIPAISVLLSTHEAVEWEKNRAGVEAILKHYAE